jgi:hypothetical protein
MQTAYHMSWHYCNKYITKENTLLLIHALAWKWPSPGVATERTSSALQKRGSRRESAQTPESGAAFRMLGGEMIRLTPDATGKVIYTRVFL